MPNHWSNEDKTKVYIQSVIIRYVQRKRKELGLADTFPALAIFDVFKGQTTDDVCQILRKNHILLSVFLLIAQISCSLWIWVLTRN